MKIFLTIALFLVSLSCFSQHNSTENKSYIVSKIKTLTEKGDYIILEIRLNNEDEFRTTEGSSSSLARIAIYTGNNQGTEVLSKGFEGMNSIVEILNKLKHNKWNIIDVYSIKGESLIITHYILERRR